MQRIDATAVIYQQKFLPADPPVLTGQRASLSVYKGKEYLPSTESQPQKPASPTLLIEQ